MNTLSIRHTLTEICQTGIDLGQCARFHTTKTEKIVFGLGGSAIVGAVARDISLAIWAGVLGGATLGCTISGVYGARQKAPWTGAIGGALVGITATGCTILASPILGGGTVGLASSAALLGIGGTGGALLAIALSRAAQSGGERHGSFIEQAPAIVAGNILTAGVIGGLLRCLLTTDEVISLSLSLFILTCVAHLQISSASQNAQCTDHHLSEMIKDKVKHRKDRKFADLLRDKQYFSVINSSKKSISYSELLHKIIDNEAPPQWFKMLLEQPGIDPNLPNAQGQTPAHSILEQIFQSTSEEAESEEVENEEGTIYFQYLRYLLQGPRIDLALTDNNGQTILEIFKSHQPTQNNNLKKISKLLDDIKKMPEEKDRAPQNAQTPESHLAKVIQDIEQITKQIEALTNQIDAHTQHIPADLNSLTITGEQTHAPETDMLFEGRTIPIYFTI